MGAPTGARIVFQYRTLVGVTYSVTPALVPQIEALTNKVRAEIAGQKAAGNLIGYLSVPVTAKSGGVFATNIEMAAAVTARVEQEVGSKLWLLNPAAYSLPKEATGGDYMACWADVLAGLDGTGADFDMAYFVGPGDIWKFFGVGPTDRLGTIEAWLAARAKSDPLTYEPVYDDPAQRLAFLRYYGLRGSTIFSKGSHDEWNIMLLLNAKRGVGDDIAIYFDGQPIEPGDYQGEVDLENETQLR